MCELSTPNYTPNANTIKLIREFEELIGQPFLEWMREHYAQGYGSRWLSSKCDISPETLNHMRKAHGIPYGVGAKAGISGNLMMRLKQDGLYSVANYSRVIRRIKQGATYEQAISVPHFALRKGEVSDEKA